MALSSSVWLIAGTNLQVFYDFGSNGTACANQRSPRVTTTLELFYPDSWGNTFAFIDLDYAIHPTDPHNTPFMAYSEIAYGSFAICAALMWRFPPNTKFPSE